MAYLFAAVAMLFWGIAPIFGKLGLNTVQPLAALTLRSLIVSVILLVAITLSGQWGSMQAITAKDASYIALEGICAALLAQIAYYYALKFGEVGSVSPIAAAFPLVAVFFGILFLGETLTLNKLIAAAMIVGGIILLKA